MYNRLGTIPACDRQTDRQTSCHGIVRAMHTRRAVIMFSCLRRNVDASCHKHFVDCLSRIINDAAYHRSVSPTCHGPAQLCDLAVAALTSRDEARYRSWIAIFVYPICIRRPHYGGSRQNIAIMFGKEKLEWHGLPEGEKNIKIYYSFWQNTRMWQTDKRTDGHRMTA